jgi:hypothetical protein
MRWLALILALSACGDNAPPRDVAPDCSAYAALPAGWGVDSAREAMRQSLLRQRLRYRESVEPGFVVRETEALAAASTCPQPQFEAGRILFEQTFSVGQSLQRVQSDGGGPEAASCTACHAQRGPGGGGGLPDASFLLGDGDSVSSGDARNPPALAGAGIVEELAAEMTAELARIRDSAQRGGKAVTVDLVAKGVSFGTLAVDAGGHVDTAGVRGVDPDLVIKPFGWKGSVATVLEMVPAEAEAHLGVTAELSQTHYVALATYVAGLDAPFVRPLEVPVDRADPLGALQPYEIDAWAHGRVLFDSIGCGSCHVPQMTLDHATLRIGDVALPLGSDGDPVFAFSDFKRHDLGDDNASQHLQGQVGRRLYLTRPLWGMAGSAPYFHDGKALTVDAAVARHGGEGSAARDAWAALPAADQSAIRIFLASLRRGPRLIVP